MEGKQFPSVGRKSCAFYAISIFPKASKKGKLVGKFEPFCKERRRKKTVLKIFCTSMTKEEKGKNAAMSSCPVVRPTGPMENSFHALGLDESGTKKPAP